jgi:hypothetical protein
MALHACGWLLGAHLLCDLAGLLCCSSLATSGSFFSCQLLLLAMQSLARTAG